jgi:SAM-dependent methyltransferase
MKKNEGNISPYVNSGAFTGLLEAALPRPPHNRYQFYKNYALDGISRGEKIYEILRKRVSLAGKKVLDLGCGYGGTSIYFAGQGCSVLAVDKDHAHIKGCLAWAGENNVKLSAAVGLAEDLAVPDGSFDIIILHDVLEHVNSVKAVIKECGRVLKKGGFVFLTLPNRLSILNIISDPHFGYFGFICFPEKFANFYLEHFCRSSYGYKVESYPGQKFTFNTCLSNGITLEKIGLSEKFHNASLIGSTFTERAASFLNRNSIVAVMDKAGLLAFIFALFSRFISRGFIFVGKKDEY